MASEKLRKKIDQKNFQTNVLNHFVDLDCDPVVKFSNESFVDAQSFHGLLFGVDDRTSHLDS